MANTVITADIVAAEAVRMLDNNLTMANLVFRGYENEFDKRVNGYKPGASINVRVPTDYVVRSGRVMDIQNITERQVPITVDKQRGVDFEFTSADLTLSIGEISKRFIAPAMRQLANQIDIDLMAEYKNVPAWVGTPGQTINSFSDFALAPAYLDEFAVPVGGRNAVLSPADHWGLIGNQTGLYIDRAGTAYRDGSLGNVGGVSIAMAQNVASHTVGDVAGTTLVDQALNPHTAVYADYTSTWTQTVTVDGFTSAAPSPAVGDIFTIAGVFGVNPTTKARMATLRMFVVKSIANASGNQVDITFSPPIITSGAQQTVYVASGTTDLNNAAVTFMGTSSTAYRQNMVFNENAFALVTVPMERPPGATDVSRQTYKGTSVRVIPVYNGINDVSAWRLDVLYATATIDPRQAVRLSGTA